MNCIKAKKMLNEAKLKGLSFVILDHLEIWEIQELKECGYTVTSVDNKFKINEL